MSRDGQSTSDTLKSTARGSVVEPSTIEAMTEQLHNMPGDSYGPSSPTESGDHDDRAPSAPMSTDTLSYQPPHSYQQPNARIASMAPPALPRADQAEPRIVSQSDHDLDPDPDADTEMDTDTETDIGAPETGPIEPDDEIAESDWDELFQRYTDAIKAKNQEEANTWNEFARLMQSFNLWHESGFAHENERGVKRLRTQVVCVQGHEAQLQQKKEHYATVVKAFEAAMALFT